MKFKSYLNEISFKGKYEPEEISKSDISRFVSDINSVVKKYGAKFELTDHFVNLRLKDDRNKPLLALREIEWVMKQWFKENGALFKKDVENVKNNLAKPRGDNKKQIPYNNLEWVASGKIKDRNFVHVVFALRQDGGKKGTALLLPQTIIRTKNKKATKGEYYEVKGELNMLGEETLYEMSDTWKLANKKFSLTYDPKKKKYELILQGSGKVQKSWVIDDKKHTAWKVKISHELYDKGYQEI